MSLRSIENGRVDFSARAVFLPPETREDVNEVGRRGHGGEYLDHGSRLGLLPVVFQHYDRVAVRLLA